MSGTAWGTCANAIILCAEKIPTLPRKKPGFRGDSGDSGPQLLPLFSAASVTSRKSQLGTTRCWKLAGSWPSLADSRRSKEALAAFSPTALFCGPTQSVQGLQEVGGPASGAGRGLHQGSVLTCSILWPQRLPTRYLYTWAKPPTLPHSNLRDWMLSTLRVVSWSHRVHSGFNNGLSNN